MHEAKSWQSNVFTTFTYADEKLPLNGSLHYPHFQGFMHRLRAKVNYRKQKADRKTVRFFCAGEYGSKSARPHYHAIIFNLDIPDLVKYDDALYTSDWLDALWSHGQTKTGAVTFESAAYCARYCLEKINGDASEKHYRVLTDPHTGEMASLVHEFAHMSRRPGIGHNWFHKFKSDYYPHGKVVINGKETNPPKYYDRQFKKLNPSAYESLLEKRIAEGEKHQADNTRARLLVKDQIAKARTKQYQRDF